MRQRQCKPPFFDIRNTSPQVLFDEAGVRVVPFQVSHPNFITKSKVIADVVTDLQDSPSNLAGRIILIVRIPVMIGSLPMRLLVWSLSTAE